MKHLNWKVIILLLSFLSLIVFRMFAYAGHFGFDDMHYAQLANDFSQGKFYPSDHFSYRFTILIGTAIAYLIGGINDWSSSIPPLLFSMGTLWLVFLMMKKQSTYAFIICITLILGAEWYLFYGDKLMPDIYVCFAFVLAFYAVYRQLYLQSKKEIINGLLLALALFLGFVSKGTIVLIVPWLCFIFIIDLWQKRNLNFWKNTFLFGFSLLGIYFISFYFLFDNALVRFDALAGNSYANRCSYDLQSLKILAKRLSSGYWGMAYREGLLFPFVILLPGLFSKRLKEQFKLLKETNFFSLSAWVLLLSGCFMSISFTNYNPMCLDVRHYLFIIPMAAMGAGSLLALKIESRLKQRIMASLFIIVLLISFFLKDDIFEWTYLGPLAFLSLLLLIKPDLIHQKISKSILIALLLIPYFYLLKMGSNSQYENSKSIIQKELLQNSEPKYIVTNAVQARIGNYYQEFKSHPHQFLAYDDFDSDTLTEKAIYILTAWQSRALTFLSESELPFYVRYVSEEELAFENENPEVKIYKVKQLATIESLGQVTFNSTNDFEANYDYWNYPTQDLNQEEVFEGNYSNKVYEYSATLHIPIDSNFTNLRLLHLNLQLQAYVEESSEANMVVSFENKEGSLKWIGLGIDKQIQSYSKWWPIKHELILKREEIEGAEWLKVYLWNKDKKHCLIDNFSVQISKIE